MKIYCGIFENKRIHSTSLVYWVFLGSFIFRTDFIHFGKRNKNKKIRVEKYFKHTNFTEQYLSDESISGKVEQRLGLSFIYVQSFSIDKEIFKDIIRSQLPSLSSEFWTLRKNMLERI